MVAAVQLMSFIKAIVQDDADFRRWGLGLLAFC